MKGLPTLMEAGARTGPPALCWSTKDATAKEVMAAGLKNVMPCAFQAPFPGAGLQV